MTKKQMEKLIADHERGTDALERLRALALDVLREGPQTRALAALVLGVSLPSLHNWMDGKRPLPVERALQLARWALKRKGDKHENFRQGKP